MQFSTRRQIVGLLLGGALSLGSSFSAQAESALVDAINLTRPLLDMRLRYEFVDQDPLANDANAFTLRTRAGFETGKAWGTSLLMELEAVMPLSTAYNNSFNGKATYPTVPDGKSLAVNRLQLTNISLPSTAITFGRQRINLEDQRFIGNAGWRQNEQTFDAVRVVNKSLDGFTVDATYVNNVNRVFGEFSPQGHYTGDTFLMNGSYVFSLGKITAFAYLLQFDEAIAIRDSSQTYGFRFAGTKDVGSVKVGYAASFAAQKNYDNNPLRYSDHYYLAELSGAYTKFQGTIGYEMLEGNGTKGFTTPLATLHKFNGWADKFLTTPPNGLRDIYGSLVYTERNVGPFASIAGTVTYHRYDADFVSLHYGNEINAQIAAKWQRYTFTIKFADYDADRFATDTQKAWLQVEFAL
jgi:hypothetical protein